MPLLTIRFHLEWTPSEKEVFPWFEYVCESYITKVAVDMEVSRLHMCVFPQWCRRRRGRICFEKTTSLNSFLPFLPAMALIQCRPSHSSFWLLNTDPGYLITDLPACYLADSEALCPYIGCQGGLFFRSVADNNLCMWVLIDRYQSFSPVGT